MATWNQAVQQMGKFYQQNIHTYQGGKSGAEKAVPRPVRPERGAS